ncbi:unnamed protein product [Brassica oleracea]|uniref:(rape) hypothetical protein n=1 Tax=Brassica napus TaxID=3708 RepID=A0A816LIE1_BRANA|nr:unnamed protein product [Brassica napus]
MSNQTKGSSSSAPDGARSRRRRGEKQRGIPQFCRCVEEAVIRTSGTTKNPGRLFYYCPKGSEENNPLIERVTLLHISMFQDKFHLFTWTDERVVEEVEDLKCEVCELNADISDVRAELSTIKKESERIKLMVELADIPYF